MGIHDGHRERLKQRFIDNGIESFNEINLLELLLFYSIPRKDTNEIAHNLINQFKSFEGVLSAPVSELINVPGISLNSAVFLKLIHSVSKYNAVKKTDSNVAVKNSEIAAKYLLPRFMYETDELVMLMCLDSNKKIKFCGEISRGIVNSVDINARLIAELSFKNKASSIILAHNHPDGNVDPSNEDISTTRYLANALNGIGISLVDHIIISNNDYSSLCDLGLL